MTPSTPTTLPEALAELALVRAELERWRAYANAKIEDKKQLKRLVKELADGLEEGDDISQVRFSDLLQRAKEATK